MIGSPITHYMIPSKSILVHVALTLYTHTYTQIINFLHHVHLLHTPDDTTGIQPSTCYMLMW